MHILRLSFTFLTNHINLPHSPCPLLNLIIIWVHLWVVLWIAECIFFLLLVLYTTQGFNTKAPRITSYISWSPSEGRYNRTTSDPKCTGSFWPHYNPLTLSDSLYLQLFYYVNLWVVIHPCVEATGDWSFVLPFRTPYFPSLRFFQTSFRLSCSQSTTYVGVVL